MTRKKALWLAGLLLGQWCVTGAGAPAEDVVFKAVNDELARSMTLRLPEIDTPYFIQYEVVDSTNYRLTASYGALEQSHQRQSRILVSQLRVGADSLDNSNLAGGRSGLSASVSLPVDDDYLALRQAIWRTTDGQYKEAVETLTRKRALLKERNLEDRPADFSKASPTTAIRDRVQLSFARTTWENYVRRLSARFCDFASIQSGDVDLLASGETRYLVNSEGSRLRDSQTEVLLRINMEAQAEDGQRLADHLSFYAPTPEQLPAVEQVLSEIDQLAKQLTAGIQAPLLDEYAGPVLFDGLAATQLFRQLLSRGFTGQPDPVGAPRRSAQSSESFETRLGKRILPTSFQVYDDPREPKFETTFLAGHYLWDDEAVPAQRVNLVVDGKLEAFVMSRNPTRQFAQSNGHGRRGGAETPRAALGCLYIESNKGLSSADLKQQLLEAAATEGLKFGLRITGLQSRSGGDAGNRSRRGGAASRVVGDPIYAFKVFVSDGHEEPVRGCEFASFDIQSLRKVLAAGSARTVQNLVLGSTPSSSIIAPAVLIGELELSRIKSDGEKKPVLAGPQERKRPSLLRH